MSNNNLVPVQYEGREQAWIKHQVLENYLKQLTAILGINNKVFEFTYIDCFAGPWGDDSSQISATSIAISLKVLSECKLMLEARGLQVTMRAIYIEKDNQAYARLDAYLKSQKNLRIETYSIHGPFEKSINEILLKTGNTGFAFFFIDPKGYTEIIPDTLRPLLERPRSEFVINFMYDFINRIVSMKNQKQVTEGLFGEVVAFDGTEANRELTLVNLYRNHLKRHVPTRNVNFPVRSAHATVLDPRKDRTKYHLVFITTHHKGIIKFKETYEETSVLQDKARAEIRENKKKQVTGMVDMFNAEEPFVDTTINKNNEPLIDHFWLTYIGESRIVDEKDFADILEAEPWFPKELQASLSRLIKDQKVKNQNALKPRRSRPLHYEVPGGERLVVL
ncbi:MAG: three-Cys-motif partner protein TcmP [Burkholderiaceae bacterium]